MDLKYFIRTYDDILDENVCKNMIELFNKDVEHHDRWDRDGRPQFTQVNVTQRAEGDKEHDWMVAHNQLITVTRAITAHYISDTEIQNEFPPSNTVEQFRMKKYDADLDDRFEQHIDVGDHDSARRFLVLFFYLNDVEEGGETTFPRLDLKIKPKRGSVLIFPPMWMYPHAGEQPVSNDKYIVGTYLHYK